MDRILEQNDTLFKLFEYSTARWSESQMASYIDGTQSYTYRAFREKVMQMSALLSRHHVFGGKVAILAENGPNWTVAFFASAGMGRVAVPVLPASSSMEVSNILEHSESEALFVSARQLRKVEEGLRKKMKLIIDIDTLGVISAMNEEEAEQSQKDTVCNSVPHPSNLAAIIYTSGTSGCPKGVMLSHSNLIHSILEAWHAQKADYRDRWLSILPMAHAYEMALGMLYPFSVGACVYYLKGMPVPSVLLEAMRRIRPTIILTVPLIMEKIYKSVCETIDKNKSLSRMRSYTPWLLNILLGVRLRKMMGGRLKFFGIGGAKLNPEVETFLHRIHFPYAIGYGLTETAPLVCNACVGRTRVGSIGVPAYGVEVRLDNVDPATGEGEIVARGRNVMLGYYKDPDRTAKAIGPDGWFHTGDLAAMDARGRFYIRGRLNNVILGATGENIYPEEIEFVINSYPGVGESLVVERGRDLVGLVHMEEGAQHTCLASAAKAILEYVNKRVNKQSALARIEVLTEPFKKTATQKIRRFLYMTPSQA
ncbi:MAG TPA: AMP-binding protein [Candidatus Coprenecus pullistercoris]|nr:AMP-binding protein [Candidatus Coprenecus pullistercoris]